MKTCYIVGAGDFFGSFSPTEDDLVIAADGGYDTLCRLKIRCDLLIGDMDSINSAQNNTEKIVFPVEKDETDMLLAYMEGSKRGYTDFCIFGGVGGRIDHTFANLSLLIYAKNAGHTMEIVADGYRIFAIKNEKIKLSSAPGSPLSVFAFEAEASGVCIRGAKYEAENIVLLPSFPLGVSNSFVSDTCEIEVKNGTLLIMKGE